MKLGTLHVRKFRGIKDLRLDLQRENFVIAGPNGSGKSGVVDAIEFVFTGRISRLEGAGTGGLSVKEHGPHVDDRETPKDAQVELSVVLDDGRQVTISRSVDKPSKPRITPPEAASAIEWVAEHPEVALSRREIIKFILAEPGQRSKELQAVLKLDRLETCRKLLGRSANKLAEDCEHASSSVQAAREDLRTALDTKDLTVESMLSAVNDRRRVLGLSALAEITNGTALSDGLGQVSASNPVAAGVDGELVKRDLAAIEELVRSHQAPDAHVRAILSLIDEIEARAGLVDLISRHELIENGLALTTSDACPLCDHVWDPGTLLVHLRAKLHEASEARTLVDRMRAEAMAVRGVVQRLEDRLETAARHAVSMGATAVADCFRTWRDELMGLRNGLGTTSGVLEARGRLAAGWARSPLQVAAALEDLTASANKLPPRSRAEEARSYLVAADHRLGVVRAKMAELRNLKARSAAAARVKQHFDDTVEEQLGGLYTAIEGDLVRFYEFLNKGDEDGFSAKLTPESGKVSLEVAFYGRGMFPPGAYHSEGHQDGMGLCLYLALMRQLFGERFSFGVLDDVVMSVDKGHRRRVCELLKTEFAGTQFVITTHDDVWLHQMIACQLVKKRGTRRFRGWSLERGPLVDDYRDTGEAIEEHLSRGDCSSAAALLRRHLEQVAGDLCERLEAQVRYRRDADHSLGDLLSAAVARWGKLLGKAKDAASSWGHRTQVDAVAARELTFKERLADTQMEQWAINKSVHYNEWANLTPDEFRAVVSAYRELLAAFLCPSCDGWIDLLSGDSAGAALACGCKQTCLNLQRKPAK